MNSNNLEKINNITTIDVIKRPHLMFTPNEIPLVINVKYITSSKGFLTGFLNLTIDNAPIIPNDKAKLLEITLVIT